MMLAEGGTKFTCSMRNENFVESAINKTIWRWLGVVFCGLMAIFSTAQAQTRQFYSTLSTVWARPMAMGGAFMAVEDHLPALLYNAANFAFVDSQGVGLTAYFNPMGLITAVNRPEHLHGRMQWQTREVATALELFVRGLAIAGRAFAVVALFGEESPAPEFAERSRFLEARHYASNQYSLLAGRMRFGGRVAIGGSVGLYYLDTPTGRQWGVGSSYGVALISTSNIRIGVSYWSFPKKMPDYRRQTERLVHEAVNLGIAYQTRFGLLMAMDIRNLGEEASLPVRELHFGAEQKLFSWLVLRGGYFRDRLTHADLFSAGIGLIDQNKWRSQQRRLRIPDWAVQYALRYERQNLEEVYHHALTFLIRL
jgi:hypothetical protein